MRKLREFVSSLFRRPTQPAFGEKSRPRQDREVVSAPRTSALAQEHSSSLAERSYTVDERGIRWSRIQ
jgi:hypothetical protein